MKTSKLSAMAMSLAMSATAVVVTSTAGADEIVVTGQRFAPTPTAAPDASEIHIDIVDYVRSISASLSKALGMESKTAPGPAGKPPVVEVASVDGRSRG